MREDGNPLYCNVEAGSRGGGPAAGLKRTPWNRWITVKAILPDSKFKILLAALLLPALLGSCAYFNTLYNARRTFKEAEETAAKDGNTKSVRVKYDEVAEGCAKVIRDYPDSRWVDDAIFLMGKALVRKEEYNDGIRKFLELITNYPESDYVPASLYWLALANYEKRDYNQALVYTQRFLKNYPDNELRYQVLFLAGDISVELENNDQALDYFSMVAEEASKREIVDKAILKSADLHYRFEDWKNASVFYERAFGKGLNRSDRYLISLKLGQSYAKTGRCREALEILETTMKDAATTNERGPVELGQALAYACMDSLDRAIDIYKKVTVTYPGSDYSAEACYRLGLIYQEKLDSLQRAQEFFEKVGRESSGSKYASTALQKSGSLKRLIELQKSSAGERTAEQEAENKFYMAELQLTKLDEINLAIRNYTIVADSFPGSRVAPKAAYALAWIRENRTGEKEKAVELYGALVMRYPCSHQAAGAVEQLVRMGENELAASLSAYIASALIDSVAAEAERGRMAPDTLSTGGTESPPDSTSAARMTPDELRKKALKDTRYPLPQPDEAVEAVKRAPADSLRSARKGEGAVTDTLKNVPGGPGAGPDTLRAAGKSGEAKPDSTGRKEKDRDGE